MGYNLQDDISNGPVKLLVANKLHYLLNLFLCPMIQDAGGHFLLSKKYF